MKTIEIDFDVYKALTIRRDAEEVSYNDVLRELLGLPLRKIPNAPVKSLAAEGDWIQKGVRFPHGTEFRATYKGQMHQGKVESGAFIIDGQKFDSPSAAAVAITGNPVNGWIFWECRLPGRASWQQIKSLRK